MKKNKLMVSVIGFLVSSSAFATGNIICNGQAEGGSIQIQNLFISKEQMLLKYSVDGGEVIARKYIVTEYFQKNGSTDLRKQAYFIGATKSGSLNDHEDIALPHYGLYKSGLGSEIAFNHENQRVFGTVNCDQQK